MATSKDSTKTVKRPTRRKKSKRAGLVAKLCIVAIILLLTGLCAFLLFNRPEIQISARTVEFGLRNMGELVTQAGYFTSVQTISGSRELFGVEIPFTQNRYIYSYDGRVKAGLDFSKINLLVDDSASEIHVQLPEIEILDVSIDENSLEVYDEVKSIYNPLKISDMNESLLTLKQEVTEKAIQNGLLENARTNAENLINGFLRGAFSGKEYTIIYD